MVSTLWIIAPDVRESYSLQIGWAKILFQILSAIGWRSVNRSIAIAYLALGFEENCQHLWMASIRRTLTDVDIFNDILVFWVALFIKAEPGDSWPNWGGPRIENSFGEFLLFCRHWGWNKLEDRGRRIESVLARDKQVLLHSSYIGPVSWLEVGTTSMMRLWCALRHTSCHQLGSRSEMSRRYPNHFFLSFIQSPTPRMARLYFLIDELISLRWRFHFFSY